MCSCPAIPPRSSWTGRLMARVPTASPCTSEARPATFCVAARFDSGATSSTTIKGQPCERPRDTCVRRRLSAMPPAEAVAATFPPKRQMTAEKIVMKAIVVTDQAAGMAGMKLVERPKPPAAINDVTVQIHASGFVPTELAWPSTWTDRRDRDRTPSIPGHELAGVVTALG